MHPNAYLQSLWRTELRPAVFVAMSFAPAYELRFQDVIVPAIQSIEYDGEQLRPHRVDISKSGDSIISEIVDGIAHSVLVLADVSSIGKDSISGKSYRNANVLYEVGIALACRQPQDVLLVRDDQDHFLFDVSTIPHLTMDFTSIEAVPMLREALQARIQEQNFLNDARVVNAISTLTIPEAQILRSLSELPATKSMNFKIGAAGSHYVTGIARLLDKGLIAVAVSGADGPSYLLTKFGRAAVAIAQDVLPVVSEVKPSQGAGKARA